MEKQFQLDPREQQQMAQIEQGRTQALASIGALSLDMETAKRALDVAQERHRSFLQGAVAARGIEQFENARTVNGSLVVILPDEPAASTVVVPMKANGKEKPEVRG